LAEADWFPDPDPDLDLDPEAEAQAGDTGESASSH
jgi:hypothetical protein